MSESDLERVLHRVAAYAVAYRRSAGDRPHAPMLSYAQMQARAFAPTPEQGLPLDDIVSELIALTEPGLAAMVAPRFFGWVIGASEPAGLVADWLATTWGQNAANSLATPAAAAIEQIATAWLLDILSLPREASVGLCTGATVANFTCLAAARGSVLARVGWDVEGDGLFGAPPIQVIVGDEAHTVVFGALRFLGLGANRVTRVPVDDEGRMQVGAFERALETHRGPTIAIAQAGHINSGAFDHFASLVAATRAHGAWLHVDGAFGLWARAAPDRAPLTDGIEGADSWAVDGHKWLQTPYDTGFAIVRDREAHRRSMNVAATYLPATDGVVHPSDFVPELSRRARGFATWAMLRSLGREGVAELVTSRCRLARHFADRLRTAPDVEIVNDVVLNQIAVRLGTDLPPAQADALTIQTVDRIVQEGTCFVGGAVWHGRQIIRVSITNARTTAADVDRGADAVLAAWRAVRN